MKKWICLVLGLCMTVSLLAACGEDDEKGGSSAVGAGTSSIAPVTVSPSPTPEQTAKAVRVKASVGLNVRAKASTDGEILGLAKDGSKLALLVEDEQNGWYQVSYNGKAAYVSAEYADVVEVTLDEYNSLKANTGASGTDSSKASSTASAAGDDDPASASSGDSQDKE